MNEFFSAKRFARLFVKHTREHIRTYLMSAGVLMGVLVLAGAFLFFIMEEPPERGFQTASYVILLFLAGTIFTSTVFQDFGDRAKAIPAMTLPASMFEKFLVGWVWSFPIFIVVYTSAFYLALLALSAGRHIGTGKQFQIFTIWQPEFTLILVMFALLHAFMLFGAIFFRKLHFIKTGFIFFIFFCGVIVGNTLLVKAMIGFRIVKMAIPFGFLNFYVKGQEYTIVTNRGPLPDLGTLAAAAILIWTAAYFKLKERQV